MKSRRIEFRATEYEAAQWDALAAKRGVGISDLCRALLNAEVVREAPVEKSRGTTNPKVPKKKA